MGGVRFAIGVMAMLVAVGARADDAVRDVAIELRCPSSQGTGRVRCDVEARVAPGGRTITWADVVMMKHAAFVGTLRGRIGPHDATTQTTEVMALGARARRARRGSGDVRAACARRVPGGVCTPWKFR